MSFGDPLSGRELAAFVTTVETGSVQGASDALALTQQDARLGARVTIRLTLPDRRRR
jgi:hypothetical protein